MRIDMRAAAASRTPRALVHEPDALLCMLEASEPPLALLEGEVTLINGRPPQNLATGEGYVPSFEGVRAYWREHHLVYRRQDGRTLHYEYEGALAYTLAEIDDPTAGGEPGIVSYMREKLAKAEADGRADDQPGVTVVGGPWRNMGGVRPKIVDQRATGERVYLLTVGQTRKFLAAWDARQAKREAA